MCFAGSGGSLMQQLKCIKEQNNQILAWIRNQHISSPFVSLETLENFPVQLPLKSMEELELFELHLISGKEHITTLAHYLSGIGGKDGPALTNNIMKRCLSNDLATKFSYMGTRHGKRSFQHLAMRSVIIDAVRKRNPNATEKDVEMHVKVWLKHAPQRLQLEAKRKVRSFL